MPPAPSVLAVNGLVPSGTGTPWATCSESISSVEMCLGGVIDRVKYLRFGYHAPISQCIYHPLHPLSATETSLSRKQSIGSLCRSWLVLGDTTGVFWPSIVRHARSLSLVLHAKDWLRLSPSVMASFLVLCWGDVCCCVVVARCDQARIVLKRSM